LSVSVPERLAEEIERMAEEGVPKSELVRLMARAYRLALRGAFALVTSEAILTESREKLASKFDLAKSEPDLVAPTIRGAATIVDPETELTVLDDEPDNRILECAVAAGASAIVTGDEHLLALKTYAGIGIMTVADSTTLLQNPPKDLLRTLEFSNNLTHLSQPSGFLRIETPYLSGILHISCVRLLR
jgi:putative PIN family toxin of toxin-antitoxin system